MTDLQHQLYLIADEMRNMATLSKTYAANVYEVERAQQMMNLAVKVAALADEQPETLIKSIFEAEPWQRFSPAIGVDALVLNVQQKVLMIQRRDNQTWALPGGIAEVGQSFTEAVLRELWEEAGLRGRATRLLGVFDGNLWQSRYKVHIVHLVYRVECVDLNPQPGIETLDARFFDPDNLPRHLFEGHGPRIMQSMQQLESMTFFDPADSSNADLPLYQRPPQTKDQSDAD